MSDAEGRKRLLAEALHQYPTWGHAYLAACGLLDELDRLRAALEMIATGDRRFLPASVIARDALEPNRTNQSPHPPEGK